MKKKVVISALALVVAVSFAMPAFGAPSPTKLVKQALGLSKKADKRSKQALKLAKKYKAGVAGAVGAQGAAGPQGPQGPQGLQGLAGVQNVTPLASGDTRCSKDGGWLVTFSSGDPIVICNGKEGPPGLNGQNGAQGPKGDQGNNGANGLDGAPGQQGAKGDKGDNGAQGLQGAPGQQGAKGDKGDNGAQGLQGAPGQQGLQGLKGDKGDPGSQGAQGIQGAPGLQGNTGPQGPQGAQGPKGDKGPQGDQGQKGDQGPQGPQGDPAAPGAIDTPQLANGAVDDTKVKKHSLGTGEIGNDTNAPLSSSAGTVSLAKSACADMTATVTGATTGSYVVMNAPSDLPNGLMATPLAPGNGTVTVRVCNIGNQTGNGVTVPSTGWGFWVVPTS